MTKKQFLATIRITYDSYISEYPHMFHIELKLNNKFYIITKYRNRPTYLMSKYMTELDPNLNIQSHSSYVSVLEMLAKL